MIKTIQMINFQDKIQCKDILHSSIESFLPINYTFKAGNIYALVSDFGCGSWGVATSLAGRATLDCSGEVYVNGNKIHIQQLSEYACFLTEPVFPKINTIENLLTPKECIRRALTLSGVSCTVEEIKEMFSLTSERFERPLENCSGEIWPISLAVNYALGKQIFCFPWLNMNTISRAVYFYKSKIFYRLKKSGKIIIIPSSQKKYLNRICDHSIYFTPNKIIYK